MVIRELLTKIGFSVDQKPLEKLSHNVEGLKGKLELLAGAEIIRGVFELAERFSDVGEVMLANAVAAGVSTEELQKLGYAATQNAVSQEELQNALGKVTRNLYQARQGSKQATTAFKSLGITDAQIKGFSNGSDAFKAIADKLSAIPDPVKRAGAMVALLGRGSGKMAQLMGLGGAAIEAYGDKADRLGLIIEEGSLHALAELQDTLATLFQQVKAITANFAAQFAPAIQNITEHIEEFIAANRALIKTSINKWVYDITYAMGYAYGVVEDLVDVFLALGERFPELTAFAAKTTLTLVGLSAVLSVVGMAMGLIAAPIKMAIGLLGNLSGVAGVTWSGYAKIIGFAVAGTQRLIMTLAMMAAGTFPGISAALMALNGVIAATPIGVIAAGIAGLVIVAHDLWTLWHGGSIEDTWIGQGVAKIVQLYEWTKKLLGLGGKEVEVKATKTLIEKKEIQERRAAVDESGVPTFLSPRAGENMVAQSIEKVTHVHEAAEQVPAQTLQGSSSVAAMQAQPLANNSYSIDAPMTFNVPANADPKAITEGAKDAVREHMERVMRETQRGVASPVGY